MLLICFLLTPLLIWACEQLHHDTYVVPRKPMIHLLQSFLLTPLLIWVCQQLYHDTYSGPRKPMIYLLQRFASFLIWACEQLYHDTHVVRRKPMIHLLQSFASFIIWQKPGHLIVFFFIKGLPVTFRRGPFTQKGHIILNLCSIQIYICSVNTELNKESSATFFLSFFPRLFIGSNLTTHIRVDLARGAVWSTKKVFIASASISEAAF